MSFFQSPLTCLVAVGSKGAGLDQNIPHKLHHDGQAPLGHTKVCYACDGFSEPPTLDVLAFNDVHDLTLPEISPLLVSAKVFYCAVLLYL